MLAFLQMFGPAELQMETPRVVCIAKKNPIGNKSLQFTSYSEGADYGCQLQFWPCPDLMNITVTALGGIPRELIIHCN